MSAESVINEIAAEFVVGTHVVDCQTTGGSVLAGLSVRCPNGHRFVLPRQFLDPSDGTLRGDERLKHLAGRSGPCPICGQVSRYPSELGWVSDSRPSHFDTDA
jgi:hypothetical protein